MAESKVSGQVKWYNTDKGYGFLRTPVEQSDIFVHATHLNKAQIKRPLRNHEAVSFSYKKGDKGLIVTDIELAQT